MQSSTDTTADVSLTQAAILLNLCEDYVRRLVDLGRLDGYRDARNRRRVYTSSIAKLKAERAARLAKLAERAA